MMWGILHDGACAAVSPRTSMGGLGGADLRPMLRRGVAALLKALLPSPTAIGWERTVAAGMDDHVLARINRRNALDPDAVLREFASTPIGMTRRP
jgi:hypothetical protein